VGDVVSSGIRGVRRRIVGALLATRLSSLRCVLRGDEEESEPSAELEGVRGGVRGKDSIVLIVTWRTSVTEIEACPAMCLAKAEDLGTVVKTT
jgi:hypothetical protein